MTYNESPNQVKNGNHQRVKGLWESIERRFLPPYVWQADPLTFWRERVLFFALFTIVVVGPISMIPSMILSIVERHWGIAVLGPTVYLSSVVLLLGHRVLTRRTRAAIGCLLMYGMGMWLSVELGWYGAAYVWLFAASVVAGALLGLQAALFMLVLNLIGMFIVGWLIHAGLTSWANQAEYHIAAWIITATNFMLANILAAVITALLLNAMEGALAKERDAGVLVRQSETKYRRIFDGAGEGIAVIQEGKACFINDRMLRMLSASAKRVEARSFLEWIYDEDREIAAGLFEEGDGGTPANSRATIRLALNQGQILWVDVSATMVTWEGRPACLVFFSDVSERIEMEEEKKRLENRLRQAQKMEAVGTLAGGVAHDFNNILQVINGFTQLALINPDAKDTHQNLKKIDQASERASQLIRQLLLFSRKAGTRKQALDLNETVRQAVVLLERTLPKMIEIRLLLARNLPEIAADPMQIEQVLLNLAGNSADAMPDGGVIEISTGVADLPSDGSADGVQLIFNDNGHGMDQKTRERVFEPFFSTKGMGKGTGLGLASVYGIVKDHDGAIECHSAPGKGTRFILNFPILSAENAAADDKSEIPVTIDLHGNETILVVDDDASIRELEHELLTAKGYTVLSASNGEEALKVFMERKKEIALVILDVGMPGMGGHRCMRAMLELAPDTRIVIASGYGSDTQLGSAADLGAAAFLGKPFRINKLLSTVRQVIKEKS